MRAREDGSAVHVVQRGVTGSDVLIEAVLTKLGRRMAFADVTITDADSGRIAARASTVYALLG